MRSRHADTFNHDEDAPDYDADVRVEAHPIRAGYATLLAWVAQTADVRPSHHVLELGAGTGNLTTLLSPATRIVAVDISSDMLAIAQAKVTAPVTWVHEDLLAFFDGATAHFDRVVSTYAVHHLVAAEKRMLFARVKQCLSPGGVAVFGDLMFESASAKQRAAKQYRNAGSNDVADAIDQEFFWLLDECVADLTGLGFKVATRRFSDLSWGIRAAL
jgi:putative AdoMet-dependent methyltransferase